MNKFEDLIDFIRKFMNQAAFRLATKQVLEGLYKMERFICKRIGQERINKKKTGNFEPGQILFSGEGITGFYHED